MGSPEFDIQNRTDQEVHFVSQVHCAKNRYLFGFYLGKDGRRHIGFDIAQRGEGVNAERVDVVNPGIFLDFGFKRWWFRMPEIVRTDDRVMNLMLEVPRMGAWSTREFRKEVGGKSKQKQSTRRPADPVTHSGYEMLDNPGDLDRNRLRRRDTEARIGGGY